jgi:hypothetical protein
MMPAYLVTITMPDGSQGVHHGIYADGFMASQAAHEAFPEAKRVSAKPLVRTANMMYCLRPVPAQRALTDTFVHPVIQPIEGARA